MPCQSSETATPTRFTARGADNLPLSRIGQAKLEKSAPIFVYCLRGKRSKQVIGELTRMGYTKAKSIGGITRYKGELER